MKKKSAISKSITISIFLFLCLSVIALFFYEIRSYKLRIKDVLEVEMARIEKDLDKKFDHTHEVINKMIVEIKKNPQDKKYINEVMKIYKTNPYLVDEFSWTVFSWTNSNNKIIVDTRYGISSDLRDLSMRDYMKFTQKEAGKFFLGQPVIGSPSQKWTIPGGVGAELNGKYLGTMTIGFEIEVLASLLQRNITNNYVTFKLLGSSKKPILCTQSIKYQIYKNSDLELEEIVRKNIDEMENKNAVEAFYINVFGEDAKAILLKKSDKYPFILIATYEHKMLEKKLLESYFNKVKIELLILMTLLSLFLSYRFVFK